MQKLLPRIRHYARKFAAAQRARWAKVTGGKKGGLPRERYQKMQISHDGRHVSAEARIPGVFAFMGLLAGAFSLAIAIRWAEFLAFGIGPLFFLAVILAIHLTKSWSFVAPETWRRVSAAVVFTATYPLAVFAFVIAEGFSPRLLGFTPSNSILGFGLDVWIGLGLAVLISAFGTQLVAKLLFKRWGIMPFC